MTTYRLLDLCCCAGGAAVGYHRAGFEVVGVDIDDQPNYPFELWHMDALRLTYEQLLTFDAIHASPPCQGYTTITSSARRRGLQYPDIYRQIKTMLVATGKPYIIENVPGSPARNCIKLCGTQFGLGVFRHRLFESNFALRLPTTPCTCKKHYIGQSGYVTVAGSLSTKREGLAAMNIDWPILKDELNEAIPPAFTEFVGRQMISILGANPDERLALINPNWLSERRQPLAQLAFI